MSRFVPPLVSSPVFVGCPCFYKPAHMQFPPHCRVRPWPSSWERRLTLSAPPSHRRRASTVFSELQLWPAWTSSSLLANPALCAASPRDSCISPVRQSCCPPRSTRTSPRAAPSCEYCSAHARGKNKAWTNTAGAPVMWIPTRSLSSLHPKNAVTL